MASSTSENVDYNGKNDIQILIANTPNGRKIPITLEELGIPYDTHFISFAKNEQFSPSFLKISPNNKIPAIIDQNPPSLKEPLTIFESAAIMQYLAGEKADQLGVKSDLYPKELKLRYKTNEWLYFQIASLGPMSGQLNAFRNAKSPDAFGLERFTNEVHRIYNVMDSHLANVEYFNGHDFSIADIAIFPWVKYTLESGTVDHGKFPNVQIWKERVAARESVKRGLEKSIAPK
ncbi:Glutathione S-transferase 7 [Nowakowskiella sp. JEL0407]|nr:Glutathione S-transferase 7 [Nowakowskiella sp. JEL0407]